LFEIDHGESVVALRITSSNSVSISGVPSVVISTKTCWSFSASGSLLNLNWRREEAPLVEDGGAVVQMEIQDLLHPHPNRDVCGIRPTGGGSAT
jgi:hypothetical protein